jgi:acid phosphatase type 7
VFRLSGGRAPSSAVPGPEISVTKLVDGNGLVNVAVTTRSRERIRAGSRENSHPPRLVVITEDEPPVLAGAGDIAHENGHSERTAALLDAIDPDVVFTTGDNVYPNGTLAEYQAYYEPTWGRHKGKTEPIPGNHEYDDPAGNAAGYFAYFDGIDPYYAYNLGNWRVYALNSEISTATGSVQEMWLRNDLAAHPRQCVLAYWHRPRFSAAVHPGDVRTKPLWDALYAAGAELVLAGHDHNYQRFVPMRGDGTTDDAYGLRQIVVGTGGRSHHGVNSTDPRLDASSTGVYGVLKLTLRRGRYDFDFVPEAGATYDDSGSRDCHAPPP